MRPIRLAPVLLLVFLLPTHPGTAGVGDPQLRTSHFWYPGELACSTFERLFAHQAELYRHVTGREPQSDQERAIASWLWRNTHYWHGEPGAEDLWGRGFTRGDNSPREYWTGLFAHGFGLCGTTHAQWTAEMQALLGHNRSRCVGTAGHNSFEVLFEGSRAAAPRWALLDHDLSTIILDESGDRLLSIAEIQPDWRKWTRRDYLPEKQHGWLVCGLHPDDGAVYGEYRVAEYFAGYAGPPPRVYLRRGEPVREITAAAHLASSNPPSPDVTYAIDFSVDEGTTWRPLVENWRITRRGDEPRDFWSQSFCWGSRTLDDNSARELLVRFYNTGGKPVLRAEAHVGYVPRRRDPARVTFAWSDDTGKHEASRVFPASAEPAKWHLPTGQ